MQNILSVRYSFFGVGVLALAGLIEVSAQHIAPPHDHSTAGGVCWGYAMGRASGKSEGDATCNPSTVIPPAADPQDPSSWQNWNINGSYWQYMAGGSLDGMIPGNIVYFGAHAAYVVSGSPPATEISIREILTAGGTPQDATLTKVGNGYLHPEQYYASGYYRKWHYPVSAKNEFIHNGALDSSGTVIVGGTEGDSPFTKDLLGGAASQVEAITPRQFPTNYWQVYSRWRKPDGNYDASNPLAIIVQTSNNRYAAEFDKELNVTFQNSFVGVGNGGSIKVQGVSQPSPHATHTYEVKDAGYQSITAQAIYNVINGIEYTLTQWWDGNTSASRTFTPSAHTTYTAYFLGKPLPILSNYNLQQVAGVGENIRLQWTEHPNVNVTQYQIWRQIKQNGVWGPQAFVTTLNRGTTTWTDMDYRITNGYTDLLLLYDVRAYYVTENTYARPEWLGVFGTFGGESERANSAGPSLVGQRPAEFFAANFPNPFNPQTVIEYGLPEDVHVRITVYDMLGKKVSTLVDQHKQAGLYQVTFDATGIPSGVYLYRIEAGTFSATRKLVVMK